MSKDVHTEHCCKKHGCNYHDPGCTVEYGGKAQSYPCEWCFREQEDRVELEQSEGIPGLAFVMNSLDELDEFSDEDGLEKLKGLVSMVELGVMKDNEMVVKSELLNVAVHVMQWLKNVEKRGRLEETHG